MKNHTFRPIVLAAAAIFCSIDVHAQDGGEEPPNVQPVTVIGNGLVAGSDVQLESGDMLAVGETLLPGDVVIGGALVNVAEESTVVIIASGIEFIHPGSVLLTLDPETPGWRCACKCGTAWRVLNISSPDCSVWWSQNLIGVACIDPVTQQPAQWTECMQVWDTPNYP